MQSHIGVNLVGISYFVNNCKEKVIFLFSEIEKIQEYILMFVCYHLNLSNLFILPNPLYVLLKSTIDTNKLALIGTSAYWKLFFTVRTQNIFI